MFVLTLFACTQTSDPGKDTSYKGYPELLWVNVRCDVETGRFVVQGRLVGWSEEGVVQIWKEGADVVNDEPSVEAAVPSGGFREDEWCDFVEVWVTDDDTVCDQADFEAHYTALLRVTYEMGCAGEKAIGVDAAKILEGKGTDPTDLDGVCPAPNTAEWLDLEPPSSLDAEVLDSVPDCGEPPP